MPWKIIICNPPNSAFLQGGTLDSGEKYRPANVKHVVECLKQFMIIANKKPMSVQNNKCPQIKETKMHRKLSTRAKWPKEGAPETCEDGKRRVENGRDM
ncbi:hypothetical protein NPIL_153591 [Nephila pilipes]|uniref:Uncharacterized protein n=1 Tax=Nephila pilipes TaxID=299642 RepID=A0A8X6N9I1_NEPPI|nr:hypothetical protein NPIL_153591 [Nephila pilipes]